MQYYGYKKFQEESVHKPLPPDTLHQEDSSLNEVLENAFQEINKSLADDQRGPGRFQLYLHTGEEMVPSKKIGRPEVQGFVGALLGKRAQRVFFITTADFTKEAREYAGTPQNGIRIVLINGAQLARLMIKFDLGVSVERTYHIIKIDSDFFEE